MTFYIKRNDTAPSLRVILKDGDGVAVDITGYSSARFHMAQRDDTNVVDAAATVNQASAGDVQYDWQAADTATAGAYCGEFEITYSDGTIETFPNVGYIDIRIEEDLA